MNLPNTHATHMRGLTLTSQPHGVELNTAFPDIYKLTHANQKQKTKKKNKKS